MKKLSIIILSYNTSGLLFDCLSSLAMVKEELDFRVIVVDNNSSDDSVKVAESFKATLPGLMVIKSRKNRGYAGGNNLARDFAKTDHVLFLNSDTTIKKGTLKEVSNYIDGNKSVGAVTCKLLLPDGTLDPDTRRVFPTPLVSLKRLLSGNDTIYSYSKYPEDLVHEVDVIQGAFFFARRDALDKVEWFDTDYFLDGEDVDLCWRIKKAGFKIIYYPEVSIIHVKKGSKDKSRGVKTILSGVDSMEIFYKKHMWERYPLILNILVIVSINALRVIRLIKMFTPVK